MNPANSAVRAFWDAKPCGSSEAAPSGTARKLLREHAQIRYEREPEVLSFADFERWHHCRVLEIGVGMGADFVRFGQANAKITGIDLSRRSLELAVQNAQIHGIPPNLLNADGEALPFPNESFDLVYSWGVLHHTTDIDRAIAETYRVLAPDGECRLMLYHRRSLVAAQCYLRHGLARLRPFTPLSKLIATHVESQGTKAYTIKEVKSLLGKFRGVKAKPVITAYDFRFGRRRFAPRWMLRLIPDRLGWFLLIRAHK